jgi:FtsP/CotA-like multicopper oxidase with cupredoxin domain
MLSCRFQRWLIAFTAVVILSAPAFAGTSAERCPRPQPGILLLDAADLRSQNGVLKVDLTVRNSKQTDGSIRYCYIDGQGNESPTLRVRPGDEVIIHLKNDLIDFGIVKGSTHAAHEPATLSADPCARGYMSPIATNLHFHGLTIPSQCHQDEVLKTSIQPTDGAFEYKFRIPADEPPGMYWYHPHIHGFAKAQLLGGASGALIVEGTERADKAVAGLPERVFVVRDQDLQNPKAPPPGQSVVPAYLMDNDGDVVNTGTGTGTPAKDLSINFVPVPYPDYPPPSIEMKPREKQFWRVLNASAITYLNLSVLMDDQAQPVGLIALDGVPMNTNGGPADFVYSGTRLGVPPGSRVEFIVTGPPEGKAEMLVTRTVDTGPGGENDPNRPLALIKSSAKAADARFRLSANPQPLPPPKLKWLGDVAPVRVRKLYFSEKLDDPNNPASASEFYLTVEGDHAKMWAPGSNNPNIVVKQGTVEDWIIENRTNELHDFHIHQLHFLWLESNGGTVDEPYLRDTVNVDYHKGSLPDFPSVRLRMDFRDPNTVGTFVYHCHILEHEDKGMMGTIEVLPADSPKPVSKNGICTGQDGPGRDPCTNFQIEAK